LRDTSDDDLAVHEEIYTLAQSRKGFITVCKSSWVWSFHNIYGLRWRQIDDLEKKHFMFNM